MVDLDSGSVLQVAEYREKVAEEIDIWNCIDREIAGHLTPFSNTIWGPRRV